MNELRPRQPAWNGIAISMVAVACIAATVAGVVLQFIVAIMSIWSLAYASHAFRVATLVLWAGFVLARRSFFPRRTALGLVLLLGTTISLIGLMWVNAIAVELWRDFFQAIMLGIGLTVMHVLIRSVDRASQWVVDRNSDDWWVARHLARGRCPYCDYNLAGNVSGTCPECGERPTGEESAA